MFMREYLPVFKALSNETRIQIYETVYNNYFITKTQLMNLLGIENRPTLEHHLAALEEAGLLAEKEIFFENHRLVFVIPVMEIDFSQEMLKKFSAALIALDRLGNRVYYSNYNDLIDKEPDISIRTALRNVLGRAVLGTGKEYCCELCQGKEVNKATDICQGCGRFICNICSKKIKRPSDLIEIYCKKCESEFFFT